MPPSGIPGFVGLPSPTAPRAGAGGHPYQGLYHAIIAWAQADRSARDIAATCTLRSRLEMWSLHTQTQADVIANWIGARWPRR